ncbi:hypothetical protein ABE522_06095 [Stenotrophomonas pennii]|uniref:hypothetical protein n=1 Tax=Stenotrophomonas lacuserhaii TaxID=2760084 RepID=UPI0032095426
MGLLSELGSMSQGISQCWWLSKHCVVDWEAWAAWGTIAAVFVALFGPSVQRWLVKRKTNAMFSIAYQNDLLEAVVRLEGLKNTYPLNPDADDGWAVHESITKGETRELFLTICSGLDAFCGREVGLSKWPAIDIEIAVAVARAIQRVRDFQKGAELLANSHEARDWHDFMGSVNKAFNRAMDAIKKAERVTSRACKGF